MWRDQYLYQWRFIPCDGGYQIVNRWSGLVLRRAGENDITSVSLVEKDVEEKDLRKILNFGHTLGHAIEESAYDTIYHGECVGLGMIAMTSGDVREQIKDVLTKFGIKTKSAFDFDKAMSLLTHDKKSNASGISCVIVDTIGKAKIENKSIEELETLLRTVWEE